MDWFRNLKLKHKLAVIASALVVAYVLEVWLLGAAAAYIAAAAQWLAEGTVIKKASFTFAMAQNYLYHPQFPWPRHPLVRQTWVYVVLSANVLLLFAVAKWYEGQRTAYAEKPKTDADVRALTFKRVDFDLEKALSRTKPQELFLGLDDYRRPITIPLRKMNQHIHVIGTTGGGKTALAIIPICMQMVRRGHPVIVVDMKGDRQAIQLLAREAEKAGKRFYFFTLREGVPSNSYNPLGAGRGGLAQAQAERVMQAFELVYEGLAGYYSNVEKDVLIHLVQWLDSNKVLYSLADLYKALGDKKILRMAYGREINLDKVNGLYTAIGSCKDYEQLNRVLEGIDLGEVLSSGHVAYFDLNATALPEMAGIVGRLVVMDLQSRIADRTEQDKLAVIAIDEFQTLLTRRFDDLISKARSANYSLVLSHQSLANLSKVDPRLLGEVVGNTSTRLVFRLEANEDAVYFAKKTGTAVIPSRSISRSQSGPTSWAGFASGQVSRTEGQTEQKDHYISTNVFLYLPPNKSVVFRAGELPCRANHAFPVPLAEKERLEQLPLPAPCVCVPKLPPGYRTYDDFVAFLAGSPPPRNNPDNDRPPVEYI